MPVALAPTKKPLAHKPEQAVLPALDEYDIFTRDPEWGGKWKDFFRIFEGHLNGLSRTEILNSVPAENLHFIVQSAIRADLLVSREIGTVETIDTAAGKAFRHNYQEKLFLNAKSERLRSIMAPELSEVSSSVDNFLKTDFSKIAEICCVEFSQSYPDKFLQFLKDKRSLNMTDFYKEENIYPPDSYLRQNGRYFLENVIQAAVKTGILKEEKQADGRPVYYVQEGLRGLFESS